ncbi:MAG TPA: LysM peptidoglycan-binding domain-containing protein [Kofleriaceae bacterium]|nr:LysM peptidoglycan-binding domain-containing protein [Kofleriaceae bacterium]
MRKILLALVAPLVAPGVAAAQVPVYPQQQDAPINLDPGAAPKPATPPPAPKQQPQKPNVVIVGPDGKVQYAPDQQPGAAGAPAGGYYYAPEGSVPFGYDTADEGGPVSVHAGPTPELHVVRKGDTLWDICFYYFNDPWQWPKVWSYNPQITNPHWIYPGDLVRLLPRGMFAQQPAQEPEQTPQPGEVKPIDNIPPPATRSDVGIKQTAFVEKSDLEKSNVVDGAVDEKDLLTIGDSIYVSYPANNPPKVGQLYSIYKPDNSVKHGGKEQGAYVRVLGTVRIETVKQDKKARGVIVEANQEIERGARVGPLAKTFKNVPPVPPKVDAQGNIVAMLKQDQLIGQGEVVFVDLGKSSGIEVGNRMFVVRRGDAKPKQSKDTVGQDDRTFPARSLGQIVIVEVGDQVSIGLVTLSVQEMAVGDIVMMQKSQ